MSSTKYSPKDLSAQEALDKLASWRRDLDDALRPFEEKLQTILDGLAGGTFGSLSENQAVTGAIEDSLMRINRRLACPRPDCQLPSRLGCNKPSDSPNGVFALSHGDERGVRTSHYGRAYLPEQLRLVAPLPDHRKREAQTRAR